MQCGHAAPPHSASAFGVYQPDYNNNQIICALGFTLCCPLAGCGKCDTRESVTFLSSSVACRRRILLMSGVALVLPLKTRCALVVTLLFAFIASLPTTVYAQIPDSERRLWAVDFRSIPPYRQLKLQQHEVARGASVVFVDANTVAVTYRFADSTPTQAMDSVSFFDANTGALRDSLQWFTHDRFPAYRDFVCVLPTHNGEFLVLVGRSLRHYSSDHKELNVRPVPNGDHNDWEWLDKVAPDGQTALMKRWGSGTGPSEDHWLSPDTLEDHAVVPAPFYGFGYAIGRDFVVYNPAFGDDPQTNRSHVHSSRGEDRVLCAEC